MVAKEAEERIDREYNEMVRGIRNRVMPAEHQKGESSASTGPSTLEFATHEDVVMSQPEEEVKLDEVAQVLLNIHRRLTS